jgi:hypothetical protein
MFSGNDGSMRNFLGFTLACLSLAFGSRAGAEREVHVVAVGKGQPSNDVYASPAAAAWQHHFDGPVWAVHVGRGEII